MTATVLVIGATGNIGVSAIYAALKLKLDVLAVVRNQASAQKIYDFVGTKEGITAVEADVLADDGIAKVVDEVKAGKLPAFQHVISCAGGGYAETALKDISPADLRDIMKQNFESNFFAYRYTIPYLLEQGTPASFTICTGSQGDMAFRAAPAMTQGALYSMSTAACRENEKTNVRFNEIYTNVRVEVDEVAEQNGTFKSSEYSKIWHYVLQDEKLRGMRIYVAGPKDVEILNAYSKIEAAAN